MWARVQSQRTRFDQDTVHGGSSLYETRLINYCDASIAADAARARHAVTMAAARSPIALSGSWRAAYVLRGRSLHGSRPVPWPALAERLEMRVWQVRDAHDAALARIAAACEECGIDLSSLS